ncbi:MAG: DUF5655 domain-containing protein [Burkholderiales bacterium]
MSQLKYTKPQRIWLKNHPEFTERWVQERIAEDPGLLGLGDLVVKDKERVHAQAGRLDMLLQDAETNRRFEVELQLGKTDESHIVRTVEYWDIERRRYPQYDHTAVIVAEEITSRFLNVIALFNGAIPLTAIQMQAFQMGENVSLVFTTVLSETRLGLVGEDEEVSEVTDRAFWEKRASKSTMEMTDALAAMVKEIAPDLSLKYNKFCIGLAKDGQPSNFVIFRPKKDWMRLEPRLERTDETQAKLDEAGLDVMEYDARWGRYRIRLAKGDVKKHEVLLRELLKTAYEAAGD